MSSEIDYSLYQIDVTHNRAFIQIAAGIMELTYVASN
jgi:hypothetical protein